MANSAFKLRSSTSKSAIRPRTALVQAHQYKTPVKGSREDLDKQISREQANKLLPKTPVPHESRFMPKDIDKELRFKYRSNGKATLIFDKMMPKDSVPSTEDSATLKRKDVERGKCNQYKLVYDPNYAYVRASH